MNFPRNRPMDFVRPFVSDLGTARADAAQCPDLRAKRPAVSRTARGSRDIDRNHHRDADPRVIGSYCAARMPCTVHLLVRGVGDRTVVHAGPSPLRRRRSRCWLGSAKQAAKQSLSREQQAVCCGSPRHAYREGSSHSRGANGPALNSRT
jgi:hypothetical protein